MVLLFLLLALAMSAVFLGGIGRAFSVGWRDAVAPLINDYADRLAAEIGTPPSIDRARAIAERLPVVVRIEGPQVNWQSGPRPRHGPPWARTERADRSTITRQTADGHRIELSLSPLFGEVEPGRIVWITLAALLVLTALAYAAVHRMLRPIRDIAAGVRRFGAGQFEPLIPVRRAGHPDELSQLAHTVNQMAADIRQMLDAKRALLLAISHELRSPLTRARLNTELLPETADVNPQRDALLRDLQEMARLISDLLESERLSGHHAALHREPVDLAALATEVMAEVLARQPERAGQRLEIRLHTDPALSRVPLDATRIRLLLRNLLDNALRHSVGAALPPELHLRALGQGGGVEIEVRDHGPGVPEDQLPHLAQAFYRSDTARTRSTGGVGLGLYLCKLVAQAHGGTFAVRNAQPGLAVAVSLSAVNQAR